MPINTYKNSITITDAYCSWEYVIETDGDFSPEQAIEALNARFGSKTIAFRHVKRQRRVVRQGFKKEVIGAEVFKSMPEYYKETSL